MHSLATVARRNVLRRPLRSTLTVGGVALATAAYIVLIASGQGLKRELEGILAGLDGEIVVQRAGVAWPTFSHIGPTEVNELHDLPHVRGVSVVALAATQLPDLSQVPIFGVDTRQSLARMLRIVSGRPPGPGTDEAMIGLHLARRLGLKPGDTVRLVGRSRARIAGIFETGHNLADGAVVQDLGATQRAFDLGDTVNLVFLDLDGTPPADVLDVIRRDLPALEARQSDTWASTFRSIDAITRYTRFLGLIALAFAALGVSTTMSVNVAERRQEFGVLRAIGWRPGRVVRLVLTESFAISGTGALAGVALAWLAAHASEWLGLSWSTWLSRTSLHPVVLIEGAALPLVAGLVGSVPALAHLLRFRPAQALRQEG